MAPDEVGVTTGSAATANLMIVILVPDQVNYWWPRPETGREDQAGLFQGSGPAKAVIASFTRSWAERTSAQTCLSLRVRTGTRPSAVGPGDSVASLMGAAWHLCVPNGAVSSPMSEVLNAARRARAAAAGPAALPRAVEDRARRAMVGTTR